ncbi:MAG: glutamine-hydrolyzing carbamoyl-phosphate synthase small subunit [Candidatus Gastranaerophilales bacterium]|nr:glutamine-hydrolyzing carbamoyl-phosphate synthase small subunit [Candidatus Gastranaerophilales bacterium]
MGTLILQDGTVYKGQSFGALGGFEGEVVFNTSMVGYQEILSDPNYAKQILVMTYPEIGNYGVNDFDFESDNTHLVGLIVKNNCQQESHYKSRESLSNFLKKKNIIALSNIDTRSLVKKLTQMGTMSGFITSNDLDSEYINEKLGELQSFKIKEDILAEVSCKSRFAYNPQGKINIAIYDYGIKKGILNALALRNCRITVYPYNTEAKEILENDFDAVFLSNGPGNPANYTYQIAQIKQLMGKIPLFGIGLGCQLLALASGAKTYKLKYGHRGSNHPVINLENNKVVMTAQNHGYAIDLENITKFMRPTHKNLNDDTLEGFEITSLGVYAIQFQPEGKPGPNDAEFIFDEWVNIIKKDINRINEVKNER